MGICFLILLLQFKMKTWWLVFTAVAITAIDVFNHSCYFLNRREILTWSTWNCASQPLLKGQRVCSCFMICNHMLVLGNMPQGPTYVSSSSWKCIIHEGNIRIGGNGINSWSTWHILYFFPDLFPFKDVSSFLKKKCVDCQVIRFSRSLTCFSESKGILVFSFWFN